MLFAKEDEEGGNKPKGFEKSFKKDKKESASKEQEDSGEAKKTA